MGGSFTDLKAIVVFKFLQSSETNQFRTSSKKKETFYVRFIASE